MSRGKKRTYLLEKTIEINVYNISGVRIHEDVFEMTIPKTAI